MDGLHSEEEDGPQQGDRNHQPAALAGSASTPEEESPSAQILATVMHCLSRNSVWNLKLELKRTTSCERQRIFREPELRNCLHQALQALNLEMLRYLVVECRAPLEERDEEGLTVLYQCVRANWTEGAVLLLRSGADIHNADREVSNLSCGHEPMVHMTVKCRNETVLTELVKRGANIHAKNSDGYNCLISCTPIHRFTKFVWQKMNEAKVKNGGRPCGPDGSETSDFEAVLYSHDNIVDIENFIRSRDPTDRKRLLQLLGASLALRGMKSLTCEYWREAMILSSEDEAFDPDAESLLENSFCRIIGEEQLRNALLADLEELTLKELKIRALLMVEKLSPNSVQMTNTVGAVATDFYSQGDVDTAFALILHLTEVRRLQPSKCWDVLFWLSTMMSFMSTRSVSPAHGSLQTLMATVTNCLRFMTSSSAFVKVSCARPESLPGHQVSCECCLAVGTARQVFTEAMHSIFEIFQPATEEQLHQFYDLVNDFLQVYPRTHGKSILHYFPPSGGTRPSDVQIIKTLVVCSAKLWGSLLHENSPPHLVADHNGDTPLHLMAKHLSKKDLLEGKVLDCFLDHGAHLCTRNNEGKSARDILLERGHLTPEECLPSLQCLAATAFMSDPELRDNVDQCQPNKVKHFLLYH